MLAPRILLVTVMLLTVTSSNGDIGTGNFHNAEEQGDTLFYSCKPDKIIHFNAWVRNVCLTQVI